MNHAFSPMGLQGRVYHEAQLPMCSCGVERLRKVDRILVYLTHKKVHEITRTETIDHDHAENLYERMDKLWPEFSKSFRIIKTFLSCPECEFIQDVKL